MSRDSRILLAALVVCTAIILVSTYAMRPRSVVLNTAPVSPAIQSAITPTAAASASASATASATARTKSATGTGQLKTLRPVSSVIPDATPEQ